LKPTIDGTVGVLFDPVAEAGGGNVLEAVGFPLPVTIIGEMLGVPEADRPQFRTLVRDLVAIFEMQPTPEQVASADAAQVAIREYFLQLIAEKRRARLACVCRVAGEVVLDGEAWVKVPARPEGGRPGMRV